MLSLAQVKTGMKILWRDIPHEVISANHVKAGRGQAKLDTKLRNLLTQAIFEQTFQGNDRVEPADLGFQAATFLYRDGEQAQVMISDTFEQQAVKLPEERFKYLKDGQPIDLLFWRDQVIDVKLPKKVELVVTYTEPAVSGNTVNAALKPAELETGAKVQVPLFIKSGDTIIINTETGSYDARA